MTIKLAIPNKGRLHEPILDLLDDSGIGVLDRGARQLFANTNVEDLEVIFVRTQDIPNIVGSQAADLGITGHDLIMESGEDIEELLDLDFGKAEMIVAAHENSSIDSIEDIEGEIQVATEFPNVTRNYFEEKDIDIDLTEVSGATEITPFIGMADIIVDLRSTGVTLRSHGLEVIDTLFETSVRLVADPDSMEEKEEKIEEIVLAIESVIQAKPRKLLMMNVPEEKVSEIKDIIPGMSGLTVSNVQGADLMDIQAVVKSSEVYDLVNEVKEVGARDILVVPIERILE